MILIIDLSYFIFHRFYASKAYVKISKQMDTLNCDFDDENFKNIYKKGMVKVIEKLTKKFRPNTIYLSKDCNRSEIWRNAIYGSYKNRKNLSDFDGRAFDIALDEIIPRLQLEYKKFKINRKTIDIPIEIVSYEQCEADDISYVLCKKMFLDEEKIVISGDHDYMQLIDEKTEVMDLKLKSLREKSLGSASIDLLFKILVGDKSDNIPQICSKKQALELIQKYSCDEINRLYECDSKFILNKKLIDMDQIPSHLVEEVMKLFDRDTRSQSEKKTSV